MRRLWASSTSDAGVASEPVTVWWATPSDRPELWALLSPGERLRGQRLRRPEDRAHFVASRALLRLILAAHVHQPPSEIPVGQVCRRCGSHEHGKPQLIGSGPAFSITHAGDCIGVAVHARHPVGIDVEPTSQVIDPERVALASVALNPRERVAYERLAPARRGLAAVQWWARKESILKATGWGLAIAPDQLGVSAPDRSPALHEWPAAYALGGSGDISLHDLRPRPGYVGCLTVLGNVAGLTELDGNLMLRRALVGHHVAT